MTPPSPPAIDWHSRKVWHAIGYGATGAWMLLVIVVTGNNPSDPFFNTIFLVPIAGWIVGIVVGKALGPRLRQDAGANGDRREPRP